MKTCIYAILISLAFTSHIASAQKVHLNASVDKRKILIGEQINLTLQITTAKDQTISFPPIDSIAHFEILHQSKIDSQLNGNDIQLQQTYTLTSWDSGRWQLPSFHVAASNKTKPIAVDVSFTPFNPAQEYHDVKDIIEVQPSPRTTWYWYIIGAVLLLLFFILLFAQREKKPVTKPAVDTNAYAEAMQQLEALKKQSNPEKEPKIFYTRLIDIFRNYLQRSKGIQSFSKTTDDLAVQIKSLKLSPDHYNQLVQSLRLSDLVKFAQFDPNTIENETAFQTIKSSIDRIERTT